MWIATLKTEQTEINFQIQRRKSDLFSFDRNKTLRDADLRFTFGPIINQR